MVVFAMVVTILAGFFGINWLLMRYKLHDALVLNKRLQSTVDKLRAEPAKTSDTTPSPDDYYDEIEGDEIKVGDEVGVYLNDDQTWWARMTVKSLATLATGQTGMVGLGLKAKGDPSALFVPYELLEEKVFLLDEEEDGEECDSASETAAKITEADLVGQAALAVHDQVNAEMMKAMEAAPKDTNPGGNHPDVETDHPNA